MPSPACAPSLTVAFDGARSIIRVVDAHFDSAADPAPGEQLYRLIEKLEQPDVVLDFDNVRYVSSIGLTVLLSLQRQLRAAGGRLTILNVHPPVWDIFAVTRLDTLLEVQAKDAIVRN
jgi:anti-anti-sigma factor